MFTYLSPSPDLPYQLNGLAAFIIGIPLNILLLWLINRKSPKDMQMYVRILKFAAWIDLCYTLIFCLFQPVSRCEWFTDLFTELVETNGRPAGELPPHGHRPSGSS